MAKTSVVTLRFSAEELAALDARARDAGLTRSAWLRQAGLHFAGGVSGTEIEALGFGDLLRVLRGASNNLNQLAKAANRGGLFWDEGDARLVASVRRETLEAQRLYGGLIEAVAARRMRFPQPEGQGGEDARHVEEAGA